MMVEKKTVSLSVLHFLCSEMRWRTSELARTVSHMEECDTEEAIEILRHISDYTPFLSIFPITYRFEFGKEYSTSRRESSFSY